MTVLVAENIERVYPTVPPIRALTGINVEFEAGQRTAIVGKSGSGKSTLLNILGLLDQPTSGSVRILGQEVRGLAAKRIDRLRADHLGFVFQENHILGHRTVAENLKIKLAVTDVAEPQWQEKIETALEQVGLVHRKGALGRLLSGGEKQRLAVARAIITTPQIILADEPTGNLDDENANVILDLFDMQAAGGATIIIITHDLRMTRRVDRTLQLSDGALTTNGLNQRQVCLGTGST